MPYVDPEDRRAFQRSYYKEHREHRTEQQIASRRRQRLRIFERDGYVCVYCHQNFRDDQSKLSLDHVIPRSKRGRTIDANLVAACLRCNNKKKSKPCCMRCHSFRGVIRETGQQDRCADCGVIGTYPEDAPVIDLDSPPDWVEEKET